MAGTGSSSALRSKAHPGKFQATEIPIPMKLRKASKKMAPGMVYMVSNDDDTGQVWNQMLGSDLKG